MISKLADLIKDAKVIATAVAGVVLIMPTLIVYWNEVEILIGNYPTVTYIFTAVVVSILLLMGHNDVKKKETDIHQRIKSVQTGLSTDIQQVSSTLFTLHQENRIAHIKAEVDRVYNLQKDAKSISENERGYIESLDYERDKYNINSYTERRLEKLMKIKVEMD